MKVKLFVATICVSIQMLTAHTDSELYLIESSLTFQDIVDQTIVKVHLKRNTDFKSFDGMDVIIGESEKKIEIGKEEFSEFSLTNYKSLRITRGDDHLKGKSDRFQIEIEFSRHIISDWDTHGKKCMVRIHIVDGRYTGQTVFVHEDSKVRHKEKKPKTTHNQAEDDNSE